MMRLSSSSSMSALVWLFFFLFVNRVMAANPGGLQIIGAGFGRTGTKSLQVALEHLGHKTYHMTEIIDKGYGDHFVLWEQRFTGKAHMKDLVDEIFVQLQYTAAVDSPTADVWRELAQIYPDAKVILTERSSPEKWWESASQTNLVPNAVFRLLYKISPFFWKMHTMLQSMVQFTFKTEAPRTLTRDDNDTKLALKAYRDNSEAARQFARDNPGRMLIFNVAQGWEPLCEFLEVETVPDIPFPHVNTRDDFHRLIWGLCLAASVPCTLILFGVGYLVKRFISGNHKVAKQD